MTCLSLCSVFEIALLLDETHDNVAFCCTLISSLDEDVHGLLFWGKSLCYSCKCIQDKNGTRMVG